MNVQEAIQLNNQAVDERSTDYEIIEHDDDFLVIEVDGGRLEVANHNDGHYVSFYSEDDEDTILFERKKL